jgi:acetyltransferase-like isoleucine patch superfamily enzyme
VNQRIKTIIKGNSFLHFIARKIERLQTKYKRPIKGKNNVISNKGVLLNIKYDIIGDNNRIEVMYGAVVSDTKIFIRGDNHVLKIGENCQYKGGSVWFEDDHCQIEIGRNTTIERAHLAVTEPNKSIFIGEDCMFSYDIEFRTGDSHSIFDNDTGKRINGAQNIEVGNHVWIGAHSIILKGVKIEDNCVIGTNSIVTKSIPGYCIAAGIPAKVIKQNINWDRAKIYDR